MRRVQLILYPGCPFLSPKVPFEPRKVPQIELWDAVKNRKNIPWHEGSAVFRYSGGVTVCDVPSYRHLGQLKHQQRSKVAVPEPFCLTDKLPPRRYTKRISRAGIRHFFWYRLYRYSVLENESFGFGTFLKRVIRYQYFGTVIRYFIKKKLTYVQKSFKTP